jgi:pyruvyl transferase EpsO
MKSATPDIADIAAAAAAPSSPYSRDSVRKGILHYLLGRGMSAVAGFATVILLVRHMQVSAYAGYTAILGLTTVAGMLAGLGMERALTRFIPEGHLHHPPQLLARFIWVTSALRLAVMTAVIAAVWLAWPLLAAHFPGLGETFPLGVAFLMLNTAMFQLFSAVMQALVQQKTLTRILVVQWGGRLLLILALVAAYADIGLEQAVWLMAIPDGIGALILVAVIHRYLAGLPQQDAQAGQHAPWPPWKQVRRLSLDNYGYNLVAALPQGSAMIVLAASLLAAPFVAAYGFFINLIDRVKQYLPLQFMLNLAEPVLIAGYVKDGDFERLCHHNRLLYKFNLMFLMPALAWIAAVAPQLTAMLTGGKYADHAWILPLLILQLALGSHATIIQIIINAIGKSQILSVSGSMALLAMAAAIGLAILSGHPMLMAAAPLVYEAVNNLAAVAGFWRRGYGYDLQWRFHEKLVSATAIAALSAYAAAAYIVMPVLQILAAGATALLVFISAIALMRALDAEDFLTLRSLLRREDKR